MGRHLNRAKLQFGTDTRGMLDGGRYALLHTRSMEFDDLRPYVAGDEIRDIDWRASAREGNVLVKRFVSEKHHKILFVADAGRDMTALAASGEIKWDVAALAMGAVGLVAMSRSDEVGMVLGDSRGSANIAPRRGETHVEGMLESYCTQVAGDVSTSDVVGQLEYVAQSHRRRLLLIVVSDEPEPSPRLDAVLKLLSGRHEMLWLMVSDMPAVGSAEGEEDGFDVASGRVILSGATLGPRVLQAYQAAEQRRVAQLTEFMNVNGVSFARIAGGDEIRTRIVELTGAYRHAR